MGLVEYMNKIVRYVKQFFLLIFMPHKMVRANESFSLVRYFSLVSLFFMIIAVFSLGELYQSLASRDLIHNEETDNVKLTRFFSTSLWTKNIDLFMSLKGKSGDEIRDIPEVRNLLKDTQQQLKDSRLLKIKIYNTDGLTLFSTDPDQIGSDKSSHKSFKKAVQGEVVSNISFRDRFYAIDKELQKLEVMASYIPVYDKNNEINGVFELYSNITELKLNIDETRKKVGYGVLAIMALLYLVLLLIMRRASAIIKEQTKLQKAIEKKIQHQAHHDPLTGLPNRRFFLQLLDNYMKNANRYEHLIALLFIDLDHFKNINDTYGHDNGDYFLKTVANRLHEGCRDTDITARLSGDEFVVILGNLSHVEGIETAVERVMKNTTKPINLSGESVDCSISIGVSIYPFSEQSHDELLRMADSAMYQAKTKGRNNYQYYSYNLSQQENHRRNRIQDIKRAIKKNEFIVHYQPRINMNTGAISCVEALIRWIHPTQGLVPPIEFIPLAEETGDIIEIGKIVMQQACADIDSLDTKVFVSINLSVRQFEDPFLLEHLKTTLSQHHLSMSDVEMEITESTLMNNVDESISLLRSLRKMGIKISLDDFGTGYSSLSYLKKFPIDFVKIDKSFVNDIDEDHDSFALIKAISDLAHQLRLKVVAEGVETVEQLAALRQCKIDQCQGYLYSKPVPIDELKVLLKQKNLTPYITSLSKSNS